MAHVVDSPSAGAFVGPFEPQVFERLRKDLPNDYVIIPNFQLKQKDHDALEYDLVVVAPHAIYVIESKEWYGRLSGDNQEWLLNNNPKKCPLWLTNTKAKVLKSELGALGFAYVCPLLVVPDGTQIHLTGGWAENALNLSRAAAWIRDSTRLGGRARSIGAQAKQIVAALAGRWAARKPQVRRRIAGYEVIETLYADELSAEYIAKRAHLSDDPSRYRIRTWRLIRSGTPQSVERRKAIIRRPTEAVAKIGRHPNLLPVLQFDFLEDENEFYEVTDWSEFGSLHGYLTNKDRDELTLRERIEIAEGVAAALQAVHEHGVVHRNVSPEAIVIGFDRKAKLTDFDRAFIEGGVTVFEETARRGNVAYMPPELEDLSSYDFDTASDMYSFGVLLFDLIVGKPPFSSAKEARAAQGRLPVKPSTIRQGVDSKIDDLVAGLLNVADFKKRPSAADALEVLRKVLGVTTGAAQKVRNVAESPPPAKFEPGSIVDGVYRIDAELGAGAFSKVYRVFHMDQQKTYALKLLTSAKDGDLPANEWSDANKLPTHPNLAKIVWMSRLAPPDQTPYVIYEYIEGDTLEPFCDGRRRLPWPDIKRIGLELLDALAAVHAAKLVHRDIKPANILLELPTHRAKLIDFNVVGAFGNAGRAGTPRYWAPDAQGDWQPDADLFSLGIVLYELVMHRHPFPRDRPDAGPPYAPNELLPQNEQLSSSLAEFLLKAVQPGRSSRFQSADEMRRALTAIEAMYAPPPPAPVPAGRFPGITVSPEEAERPNYNPYVTRLLTLYSQARQSNSGTRGLDEIARLTYVRTRLDEKLIPALVSGNYRLVIITGNAGDGKTAFLQSVEKAFQARASVTALLSGNGSRWDWEGTRYLTNYDGSQDEGDEANDTVLARFFEPFAGDQLGSALASKSARLIAINEGRLLDFLAHSAYADRYAGLARFVHSALAGENQPHGALLVNLNLRAIAAGGDESLFERQLQAMVADVLWQPCEKCALKLKCPIKHNVDTLRDETSGLETRKRMRRLFELVHLRRRAHVTMRDLRSALSWMLLRDQSCTDVAQLLARNDSGLSEALADRYYSEAFADPESLGTAGGVLATDERAVDRLVRRLRETDIGLVNLPQMDRRLDHDPTTAVPWMTFERRSAEASQVLTTIWRGAPDVGDEAEAFLSGLSWIITRRRSVIRRLRRWAYYERRDAGWIQQLPYRSAETLERIVEERTGPEREEACRKLRNDVIDAISLSEGLRNPDMRRDYLALRITRIKEPKIRSYRLFPKDRFSISVPKPPSQTEFIEYAPDAVELFSVDGVGHARLRISLDLLEMLELIRSGYRPTTTDLQGLFVNLLIFRNELLATSFSEVLVTQDDESFFKITASGSEAGITLSATPQAAEVGAAP